MRGLGVEISRGPRPSLTQYVNPTEGNSIVATHHMIVILFFSATTCATTWKFLPVKYLLNISLKNITWEDNLLPDIALSGSSSWHKTPGELFFGLYPSGC